MERVTYLTPSEVVGDRPFTHPDQIAGDINTLRYMADQLCLFLKLPHLYERTARPIITHRPQSKEWVYRLVVVDPDQIMSSGQLTFVGFLGQRRADVDPRLADDFDEILLGELPQYDGLLSYSTMALISGNFSNLVLFSDPGAKLQWSRSRAHGQAVKTLSPDFYSSVTLYNGTLPNGIDDSNSLIVERVKYFDYQIEPLWQAERIFRED